MTHTPIFYYFNYLNFSKLLVLLIICLLLNFYHRLYFATH